MEFLLAPELLKNFCNPLTFDNFSFNLLIQLITSYTKSQESRLGFKFYPYESIGQILSVGRVVVFSEF